MKHAASPSTHPTTHTHSRLHTHAQGTIVEVEGLKNRRYWTFGVVDRSGLSLIRLSSENQAEASKWVDALVKAGCERKELSADAKERSPLRSADVRWVRAGVSPPTLRSNATLCSVLVFVRDFAQHLLSILHIMPLYVLLSICSVFCSSCRSTCIPTLVLLLCVMTESPTTESPMRTPQDTAKGSPTPAPRPINSQRDIRRRYSPVEGPAAPSAEVCDVFLFLF